MQEDPNYGKFRDKGLPCANEFTTLFKDVVATGQFAWTPSSGKLPNGLDADDDGGNQPCLENIGIDMEEGSDDSEEVNLGATNEFANINLSGSQGTASQKSGQKRKKVIWGKKMSKTKVTPSLKIADAMSVIAKSCRPRNAILTGASIGEVMAKIQNIDAITNDPEWHARCCQLMLKKPEREMFIAL